jgi:hypothetical protein
MQEVKKKYLSMNRVYQLLNPKILISVAIILLFFSLHLVVQNKVVYNRVFFHLFKNYNSNKIMAYVPYEKITNTNITRWDCAAYNNIKEYKYNKEHCGGEMAFAWFPLFPFFWKLTHLNALGISVLNLIFYLFAVYLLSSLFFNKGHGKWETLSLYALLFSFPGSVVYYVPYTEAMFILLVSVSLWGLFKNNYWIYAIGICLAAMTRSVAVILLATFFAAEFLVFLKERKFKTFLFNFFKKIIPLLVGTFSAALVQLYYGSGHLFKFIEAHKYWGTKLRIPDTLIDWSFESWGNNVATIFFIVVPCLIYIIYMFIKKLKKETDMKEEDDKEKQKEYFFNLSVVYTIVMFLFILFYKGGCLSGITRYIISTPFFFIIMFVGYDKVRQLPKAIQYSVFIILLTLSMIFFRLPAFSNKWDFSDMGYILILTNIGFVLFNQRNYLFKSLFYIIVFFNVLWATYMYNMLLTDSWICL